MPQYKFRGNLNAARFPLISTFQGRTVVIPQFDQNFQKLANFSGSDQDRDIGIPQVFYCHNVVPTAEGFQSVSYIDKIAAYDPAAVDFDRALIIRDEDENKALFSPAAGQNYFYNGNIAEWEKVSPVAAGSMPADILVTIAYVRGRTLYFYDRIDAYEYDFATNTRAVVTLNGLTVANIRGICASVQYLIAWDADNQIYWSSVTDIEDFVPSLSTGAGSEKPADLKGDITVILPFSNGFIIYTTKNAILASYTGNIRFPWTFKEIPGSAGVEQPEHVTWESNTGYHIAWTSGGLFKIEKTGAEPIFPEVTDFVSGQIFEDYIDGSLVQQNLSEQLFIKLAIIGTRYLIISYGTNLGTYTHALIVDFSLKRLGKLKIEHTDCFEWPAPNVFGVRTYDELTPQTYADLLGTTYDELSSQQQTYTKPKENIAFLQKNGVVKLLSFVVEDITADAVMFLGKFQMVRKNWIQFLNFEVENVSLTNTNFSVKIHSTFDGKNFAATLEPMVVKRGANAIKYGGRLSGENFTVEIGGAFNLVSIQKTVQILGDR